MQSSVNLNGKENQMTEHTRTFSNLLFADKCRPTPEQTVQWKTTTLRDVSYFLCERNPTWNFIVTEKDWGGGDKLCIKRVDVVSKGEIIGKLVGAYSRGNNGVEIIAKSSRKFTSDSKRAISIAKKLLLLKTKQERLHESVAAAENCISNAVYNHDRAMQKVRYSLNEVIFKYMLKDARAYVEANISHMDSNGLQMLEKYDEQLAQVKTIDRIKSLFDDKKTALLILDEGKYLVKIGDAIDLYNDTTLPISMRGNLGVLKLVEVGQMVSDIGCKVNDETFVLVMDEQPNIVS